MRNPLTNACEHFRKNTGECCVRLSFCAVTNGQNRSLNSHSNLCRFSGKDVINKILLRISSNVFHLFVRYSTTAYDKFHNKNDINQIFFQF